MKYLTILFVLNVIFPTVGNAQSLDDPNLPLSDIKKLEPQPLTKQCDERCANFLTILKLEQGNPCNTEEECKREFFNNKNWANWCRSCDFHKDIWSKIYNGQ